AHALRLEAGEAPAPQYGLARLLRLRVLPWRQDREGSTDDLGGLPAEDPLRGGIPAPDLAVAVRRDDRQRRRLKQGRQRLVRLAQRGLRAPALRDVLGQHELGRPPVELERIRRDLHVDDDPVFLPVTPDADGAEAVPRLGDLAAEGGHVVRRADILDRHREELVPRVAVLADRRLVDGEEPQARGSKTHIGFGFASNRGRYRSTDVWSASSAA